MALNRLLSGNRIGLSAGVVRGISMLLRFPSLIWLASRMSVSDFAQFILAQTIVILFTFLVGLELHQVAIRNWVHAQGAEALAIEERHRREGMLVALPALFVLLLAGVLIFNGRWIEGGLLGFIALVEYRQTETGRYLIAEGKNLTAMWLSLVRQASWMPFACLALYFHPQAGLLYVLSLWAAGSLLSELLALALRPSRFEICNLTMNGWAGWTQLWVDARIAFPFYIIVLAVMAREQVDKLILKGLAGDEDVAVYGFFATLAGLSLAIIQTMLVSENTRAILTGSAKGAKEVRRLANANLLLSVAIAGIIALLAWFSVGPLLHFMGRDIYLEQRDVLGALLLATVLQAANNTQTLALTALHREKSLAAIEAGSGALSVALNILLVPLFGALAAAAVLGGTALVASMWKAYILKAVEREGFVP